ncbi:GtrA family protein [Phenylobacterium aquaticum]|uniref:GtrA family protein n=1 Tax=Phenylobacterium aquaticum TaxID=1763816 RepID=UPI001F5D6D4C|nr:GtrA family protein [Phenylobacterium aquaticum]
MSAWPDAEQRAALARVGRYLALGGLAAAVNWGSRFGWSLILPFPLAVVCAYACGMAVAFGLFRRFVFPGSTAPLAQQARNFVLVNLVGMGLTWIVAVSLVDGVFPALGMRFHPEAIGHGLAVAAPVASSWFGHRRFSFPKTSAPS